MNYTLSRILGWIADNKLSTFLGLCLFAFVISTIVLSSQKSSLQDQLDKCNAATEKPTDPTTTQAPDQTTTQAPDTTTTKAPDTTTTVAPTTTTTTLKPDPSKPDSSTESGGEAPPTESSNRFRRNVGV
ncbi:mucosal addressin cell adhesion molecule 1-like isoform X2 [Sitodiplosis mosellana]|uniref:mucosal addressin cell adhesion molecule 1-like isoform X2 n=1 Tax=Sitodiplosis mosellana TaxID=263140 RepID=UPI002444AC3C|nr:mucosal addressin cell adhesion molecule 1-like isoform X2 [Sitodiplosis mosellana]